MCQLKLGQNASGTILHVSSSMPMSGAKPEETGLASGLINTSYQIGSALGLAVMVAFANATTKGQLAKGVEQLAALNNGFGSAFIGAAIVAGIGALVALVWIHRPVATPAPTVELVVASEDNNMVGASSRTN